MNKFSILQWAKKKRKLKMFTAIAVSVVVPSSDSFRISCPFILYRCLLKTMASCCTPQTTGPSLTASSVQESLTIHSSALLSESKTTTSILARRGIEEKV